ncbi:NAD-dependent epimerase/dehydratase family protein [Streptomyces sp. SID4937]|nr:NAD-dependent epimerase/dehydratase family protein [Streptomyces sp. SID4937]
MGMRVVVLGATGSVGRQVCATYAARGWEVHGVARRPPARPDGHRFTALDLAVAAPERIAEVVGAPPADVVVNAAGGWGDTEEEMSHSHLRLVRRLLDALALVPDGPRLVHLGSVHEYGPVPADTLLREDRPLAPVTPYARIKRETSAAVLDAARAGLVEAVVLRAANMTGPHPPQESFLAALLVRIRAALADGGRLKLTVADARRDFVDVRDVARAVFLAGQAPRAGGSVVNIGRGEAVPVGDVVGWLIEASGFPPSRVDRRAADVRSKGGDWTRLDIGQARRLLSWSPQIGLRDSVRSMWRTD